MMKETQQSQGHTENYGGGVFVWGGRACEKAQITPKHPLCQKITGTDWKKVLANQWNRKKITKKAHAGRGHETKWEMSIYPEAPRVIYDDVV
jgi:hypothetical protein